MMPNVTPRYLFIVSADSIGDQDHNNNTYSKYTRFYIKKSNKDMIISASNTYNEINVITSGGVPFPSSIVTNPDMVAGKLNLDSLMAGLERMEFQQARAEEDPRFDFDVIDRKAWDYRSIDYTLYRTLFISDELKIDETR
jgi:PDZ domain-containing secreted protein